MTEKLYMPVSLLLSALILSGTIFFVGADMSKNMTGLAVAINSAPSAPANNGGTINTAPTQPAPTQPSGAPVDRARLEAGGNVLQEGSNAPVTIVEYSDFECPFCGRAAPTVNGVLQKYGNKIKLVYKHFPLSFHPNAKPAALASECAAEQGKFGEYHDKLFENQTALSAANLKQYAVDLGLNVEQFNQCLDTAEYSSKVDAQFAEGSQFGVSGTPTFFINGQKLVGAQPTESFEAVIDPLLP